MSLAWLSVPLTRCCARLELSRVRGVHPACTELDGGWRRSRTPHPKVPRFSGPLPARAGFTIHSGDLPRTLTSTPRLRRAALCTVKLGDRHFFFPLVVRARRIELRRHAVMSCGPSHLARRANWSPCGAPTTDLPLPRRVLFHTSFTEMATAAGNDPASRHGR